MAVPIHAHSKQGDDTCVDLNNVFPKNSTHITYSKGDVTLGQRYDWDEYTQVRSK